MGAALLFKNARIATMDGGLGVIENGALLVENGEISWVGKEAALPANLGIRETVDCSNGWLTPGLIDCHTHLVWAGDRSSEFEDRLEGKSYVEICESGGGILSTIRSTRAASEEALYVESVHRLDSFIREGITTIDIKSGYGQCLESELKLLRVARLIGEQNPIRVRTGFLGAHATPPEFKDRSNDYITFLIESVLPEIYGEDLADYADAFCESVGFSHFEVERFFRAADEMGIPVRLHADQLSDSGGAELVAEFGGWSADHVEYTSLQGVEAMAEADVVAVILPMAFCTLQETQKPPIMHFRKHGVKMAVSTDCNPGTAPCNSLHLAMNMACCQFGLTVEEVWLGVTAYAAQALGIEQTVGQLKVGYQADLALWDIPEIRNVPYWAGNSVIPKVWINGKLR